MYIRATGYNSQNMLSNIMGKQSSLLEMYNKIQSNQKFSNISESPSDSAAVIGLNNQLSQIETYKKNIKNANTQLNVQDETYSTIVEKLQRIKELSVGAANGPSGPDGMKAAQEEIKQIKESIVNLANTQYDGKYIFSGADVSNPAYTLDANGSITYNGTPSTDPGYERKIEIADGIKIGVNAPGDSVFGSYDTTTTPPTGTGIFGVLGKLEEALTAGDNDKVRAELDNIDKSVDHVSETQSVFSTSVAKLTMTDTTHDNNVIALKSQKQSLIELDQTTAISEFINKNYAYQASMQSYMMISNQSLMNYM